MSHLSLREDSLWLWAERPSQLERDLVRIAFAVYAADRLVRRLPSRDFTTPVRQIELGIEVGSPDFWQEQLPLIKEALAVLCDDLWEIHFIAGPSVPQQLNMWHQVAPTICQYSGGLDSAAGAVIRASEGCGPLTFVTAVHQTHQRVRVDAHLRAMAQRFGREFNLSSARTTFGPQMREFCPRFDYQEPTQRCRAFLFMACGGATASRLGSRQVEVLENGVGAMNLPLMAGMAFGSRSTRGCHPRFLRGMSKLVTQVAGRPIDFVLPFAAFTKAEMVKTAMEFGLNDMLANSMSCVHPLRVPGRAKQCGLCPACIGRRQAFLSAGSGLDHGQYQADVFNQASSVPRDRLEYLTATLSQVIGLSDLTENGILPVALQEHLIGTGVLRSGESPSVWVAVIRRYRDEWLRLIHEQHEAGQRWSGVLPDRLNAA